MAGAEGIEPSSAVLETDILPLNYAPVAAHLLNLTYCMPLYSLQKNSTLIQKIKRKYYNIFTKFAQEIFKTPFFVIWI